MMNDLQKELYSALLLPVLSVSGDSVEIMAAAKQKLRRAFELSESVPEKEGGQDG